MEARGQIRYVFTLNWVRYDGTGCRKAPDLVVHKTQFWVEKTRARTEFSMHTPFKEISKGFQIVPQPSCGRPSRFHGYTRRCLASIPGFSPGYTFSSHASWTQISLSTGVPGPFGCLPAAIGVQAAGDGCAPLLG